MKAVPKITKWKFKKFHKPNFTFYKLFERKSFVPLRYPFAIQALEAGKLTFKQLEACRRALRRGLGKAIPIFICVAIVTPVSKKPVAVRMGKGKGSIAFWVAVIKAGKILVEINCLNSLWTQLILKKATSKLPLKTQIIQAIS